MIAGIFTPDQLIIDAEFLSYWCKFEFIEQRLKRIIPQNNMIILENGIELYYNILAINIGSETLRSFKISEKNANVIYTRPISSKMMPKNHLLRVLQHIRVIGADSKY